MTGDIPNSLPKVGKFHIETRKQPLFAPGYAGELSLQHCSALKDAQTRANIENWDKHRWSSEELESSTPSPGTYGSTPGGRRGTETELNSHGHLVFKPPNEANPKPNSFSPQAQLFFGPGGPLLGGMELVMEAEVNGEASEPTPGQLLTAFYQSLGFPAHYIRPQTQEMIY